MRNYNQAHPDAIFQDKPKFCIEIYKKHTKQYLPSTSFSPIEVINNVLTITYLLEYETIALFIIKPKLKI